MKLRGTTRLSLARVAVVAPHLLRSLAAALWLCVAAAGTAGAWDVSLGGPYCESDVVSNLAIDGNGDAVTTGYSSSPDGYPRFVVVKQDGASGVISWRAVVDEPEQFSSRGFNVAISPSGDVIAAGQIYRTNYVIAVVRLAAGDGVESWRRQFGGAHTYNQPHALVVDPAGAVVVGGGGDANENQTHPEELVAKLDLETAAQDWVYKSARSFNPWGGEAFALLVDENGDIIAGGHADGTNGLRFIVHKLDAATGTSSWAYSPADGRATVLAFAADGDIIAGGTFVARLAREDGKQEWKVDRNTTALAVDASGDVVVAGDFAVAKLRADNGSEMWSTELPRCENCGPSAIGLDAASDVFVAYQDRIAKLSGLTGAVLWTFPANDDAPGFEAKALAVDRHGDVIAAGIEVRSIGFYSVLKLRGDDGTIFAASFRPGDCDGDGAVSAGEFDRGINAALGAVPRCDCRPFDRDQDGGVTVDELVLVARDRLGDGQAAPAHRSSGPV